MDSIKSETSLSFSIENILRDDFPTQSRSGPSSVSLSTDVHHSRLTEHSWPPSSPMLQCYAFRFNPVFLRFLPNMKRMDTRFHQVNRVKELILTQRPQRTREDRSPCDEEKVKERPNEQDGKYFSNFCRNQGFA